MHSLHSSKSASCGRILRMTIPQCISIPFRRSHCMERKVDIAQARLISCQASGSSLVSESPKDDHAGHAFLHDFCMSIPYSGITLLGAAVIFILQAQMISVPLVLGGLIVAVASILSLGEWRKGNSSTLQTFVAGGVSGGLAYQCWAYTQASIVPWLTLTLCLLSCVMSVFSFYNIAAGGNPPKRK
ncbi:hypothetical protein CEUSTIGMA_g3358.t1 [Chlamydomonas eustigma]|uniref:Uncharacterized protein n=1 Tax=Chlamydomonas eustigma TaxID=1157962 RepID=A0A250WYR0_9CHLO|nr:hypothetical protein CEUSTIGMA_g3358.t1 [Chlamydomonas eustigma]|eukprot:GAX75915.1 hypothetical protein CEUSTIGMA_g3358.t1 [Chlamydomonas eustigma]